MAAGSLEQVFGLTPSIEARIDMIMRPVKVQSRCPVLVVHADEAAFRWEPETGLPSPLELDGAAAGLAGVCRRERGLAKMVRVHTSCSGH